MQGEVNIISIYSKNDREAVVQIRRGHGFEVIMLEGDEVKHNRKLYEHTEQYADDCAENWVEGIIK